jgi:hypothetical protein
LARSFLLRRAAIPAALLMLAAGCSRADARLEKLTAGIPKDSVIKIMGIEKPQRVDPYLTGGHYIEAMYFPLPGATDSAGLTDRKMSPVVVIDGALAGWGWTQWDSIAGANHIPVAKQ